MVYKKCLFYLDRRVKWLLYMWLCLVSKRHRWGGAERVEEKRALVDDEPWPGLYGSEEPARRMGWNYTSGKECLWLLHYIASGGRCGVVRKVRKSFSGSSFNVYITIWLTRYVWCIAIQDLQIYLKDLYSERGAILTMYVVHSGQKDEPKY